MNLNLLDNFDFDYESQVIGFSKGGSEAVLMFKNITNTLLCRITFRNVLINSDVDSRLAFDLNDAIDCVGLGLIELYNVHYGKLENGKYYFKTDLYHVPEKYFDHKRLGKIKYDFYGETMEEDESPVISFIADEMFVELFEKIDFNKSSIDN
ncbi:MAG: hypothetical protein IJE89_01640 [Bacilli bacterium]|nr:hypothetical protein [Bacilli bacterium]